MGSTGSTGSTDTDGGLAPADAEAALDRFEIPRGLLILVGLAATAIAVAGLRVAAGLIAPAFLGLVIIIAIYPLRGWMVRRHVPGWVATLVMIAVAYGVVLGIALSLVIATARFATLLPTYEPQFQALIGDIQPWLAGFGIGREQIDAIVNTFDLGQVAGIAAGFVGQLFGVMSNLAFIVTVLLFLAMDAAPFATALDQVRSARPQVAEAMASFAVGTRRYLVVSTIFGLIVAVFDVGALYFLAIPVPLLWGLLAFITNYIPNIGFVIGLLPPAVLGLLEGGPQLMIAVIVVYSVINVLIQTVIQPKFVGDAVGLSTTLTFMSLLFWAWVLGPLGALLAIPLSLLAKALLVDVDEKARWLVPLLAPSTGPRAERKADRRARRRARSGQDAADEAPGEASGEASGEAGGEAAPPRSPRPPRESAATRDAGAAGGPA